MYEFPWSLAILMCAVGIGAKSGATNLAREARELREAIDEFLAAQDQPPGNWDAIDKLRADRMRATSRK